MDNKGTVLLPSKNPNPNNKPRPKRFVKNQIPDSILNDPVLNAAISLLPSNYNFEVHKCIWRISTSGAKRVALQFPEGLLMYSLIISDIFKTYSKLDDCFVLGDVTYGACCIDDFSATALDAELLIHYGHSCLIPIDFTKIPSLYVFVEIKIDVDRLIDTIRLNFDASTAVKKLALAGTIQFSAAIRAAKPALEAAGFEVLIPQSKPLSAGEVLGCTSPAVPKGLADVVIFVADGRFHLESFMIANPGIKAFRYDPYLGVLFLEEYDNKGMKEVRRNAIMRAKEARNWGVVLGTLGRQGNPRILDRLQIRMREKGFTWTVVLMSEISPAKLSLFGESIDAWIQIACPRLSIDWGDAFGKPLLTPFEAEIALGFIPGWWDRKPVESKLSLNCKDTLGCEKNESCCSFDNGDGKATEESKPSLNCKDSLSCERNESCCRFDNGDGKAMEESVLNLNCKDDLNCKKNGSCCRYDNGDAKAREDATADYPMDYYAQDGGEWNCFYSKKPSHPPRRNLRSSTGNGVIT